MKTVTPKLPSELPDDVGQLKELVRELASRLALSLSQIEHLRRLLFGRKSEKLDSADQLLLALGLTEATQAQEPIAPPPAAEPEKKKGHGRKRAPRELARHTVVIDVPEFLRTCECGCDKPVIGQDVSEQREFNPSSIFIIEYVRLKRACNKCRGAVVQAPMPPQIVDKGAAGPGLLAHVLVSKYCDHLPLYRLERILGRLGLEVNRSTLCGWVMQVAFILESLVRQMRLEILKSQVIHSDDTPITVLDEQGHAHRSYIWVYLGDRGHPYTVYDWQQSRAHDGPAAWLGGYDNWLQADAYSGYNASCVSENDEKAKGNDSRAKRAGCNAHARRKFFVAKLASPVEALHVIAQYRLLYEVERQGRDGQLTDEQLAELRKEKAAPIMKRLEEWLGKQSQTMLPKSPLGEAVGYALNQWSQLTCYLNDGRLDIDNNVAERAIRPIAIGRRNWLFAGSARGGQAMATIYSIIESTKRCGVEPFEYLRDVLTRIPTHPQSRITELLPDNWKALRAQAAAEKTEQVAQDPIPQSA